MSFFKATQVDQVPIGQMKSFNVNGKDILVVNNDGKFYAISGKCPHMDGELSRGKLEGTVVTCPRHGSKFEVTTGRCLSGPKIGFVKLKAKDVATYEVKVEGNSILVDNYNG